MNIVHWKSKHCSAEQLIFYTFFTVVSKQQVVGGQEPIIAAFGEVKRERSLLLTNRHYHKYFKGKADTKGKHN